jgi:hypothetical protein
MIGGLLFFIVLFFLRLEVKADQEHVTVRFGWIPIIQRTISLDEIKKVEAIRYSPLRDFFGWGLRWNRKGTLAYTAKGNRGVLIETKKGKHLLIGSGRSDDLAGTIEKAIGQKFETLRTNG